MTNLHAAQKCSSDDGDKSYNLKRWHDIDTEELKGLIGFFLFTGYLQLPSWPDYWTVNDMYDIPLVRELMSRDRFFSLWHFLRFIDNNSPPDKNDKVYKIRPIIEPLRENFQNVYNPNMEISVDESMISFKGKVGVMQYNPNKPNKWGIKAWGLAESKSGYLYNFDLYQGKSKESNVKGLGQQVVEAMVKPLTGKGHIVFIDNFFTSPQLIDELAKMDIGACGTLRSNRKGVPEAVKKANPKKDQAPIFIRDGNTLYCRWQDKKMVTAASNVHKEGVVTKRVRSKDAVDHYKQIEKPILIESYNQHMNGVDLTDQHVAVYLPSRRMVKWNKKVFLWLLEVTFYNSLIIARKLRPDLKISAKTFRFDLVERLTLDSRKRTAARRNASKVSRAGRLLQGPHHWPKKTTEVTKGGKLKLQDCTVCSGRGKDDTRKRTVYVCQYCNNTPLCLFPCFELYHTTDPPYPKAQAVEL
jgi:hypothetical protein